MKINVLVRILFCDSRLSLEFPHSLSQSLISLSNLYLSISRLSLHPFSGSLICGHHSLGLCHAGCASGSQLHLPLLRTSCVVSLSLSLSNSAMRSSLSLSFLTQASAMRSFWRVFMPKVDLTYLRI